MSDRLSVGNVDILCLTDGHGPLPMPVTAVFPTTSDGDWDEFKTRYPETFSSDDFPHIHFGAYLVRSQGRTVLVDTGLGPEPIEMLGGMKGDFPNEFARKGVDPDAVDTVFHTHLHFDHVGWNMGDDGRPRFKNARYVCGEADWEFFQVPEVQANFPPGSFDIPLKPLEAAGVLDLVSGEHALTEEVTAIPTPGHTPGHMSLLISSGGEKAIITGDALASPAQITNPDWAFGFDADPDVGNATRRALLERIEADGLKMVACHFPPPGYGQIIRVEGKRYWQGA